jgi:hypothetical protein
MENHPGVVDPDNPGFVKQLTAARDRARRLANDATDATRYELSLVSFSTALNDGHARIFIKDRSAMPTASTRWPGFITVWRGDGLYVYRSMPNVAPEGARIVSCDGIPIRKLIERNVFAFGGRVKELGQWWTLAQRVLIDTNNPFITLPSKCAFATDHGQQTRELSWSTPPDNTFATWRTQSLYGERFPIGLTDHDGIYWIAMPTFYPDETERVAYKQLAIDMQNKHAQIMNARAVVLDLRYNQGGSSSWSYDVAKQLWGNEPTDARVTNYFRGVDIWWRVSKGNADYMAATIEEFRKHGEDISEWESIMTEMRAGLPKKQRFVVRHEGDPTAPPAIEQASDFTRPVYVIVPGQCASACLDALDLFTRFPGVKLIGAPSSADSTYLETRTELLPSKIAAVTIPLKIWVHRPRASGQFYRPDIEVNDLEWSTAAFVAAVERDLRTADRSSH